MSASFPQTLETEPVRTWINILAALTSIPPYAPLTLLIQTFLFPPRSNIVHYQTFVLTVVPLGDILGDSYLTIDVGVAGLAAEK